VMAGAYRRPAPHLVQAVPISLLKTGGGHGRDRGSGVSATGGRLGWGLWGRAGLLAEAEQLSIAMRRLVLVELPAAAEAGDDDHASTPTAARAIRRPRGARIRRDLTALHTTGKSPEAARKESMAFRSWRWRYRALEHQRYGAPSAVNPFSR
jgi:hypothetical protein